jgi:hypothetical protein
LFGLSDFTKAENSSDFTRAENWAEGVSDFKVWDIGQVTVINFDWLSFTPPLIAFSDPSVCQQEKVPLFYQQLAVP